MTSGNFLLRAALVAVIGCCASVASPCSVSRVLEQPFSLDSYGFYGEVTGYVSMRLPGCENTSDPASCLPAWGLRIHILEPLRVPARDVSEVEYFAFGTGSDCRALPLAQDDVQRRFPAGTRVALAARLFTWDEPKPPRIRLTSLLAITGEAIAIVPPDADLRKFAAAPSDYASIPAKDRPRRNFELWRDTLRLQQSGSESEALAILLRMSAVDSMGIFAEDQHYSAIEQLVDQYLPTPAVRAEFARRLHE